MKQHYTIQHKGSRYGGIDLLRCAYCNHTVHTEFRMNLHLQAFHPEKLIDIEEPEEVIDSLSNLPKAELIEKAKAAGVAIYGTKEDIIERLQEVDE